MSAAAGLRWAGSKASVAARIAGRVQAHLERTGGRLISPFYGAGHVEVIVKARQIAADACPEIRALWLAVRTERGARDLHSEIVGLYHLAGRTPEGYDKLAALQPGNDLLRAARFVLLNRWCYSGLWRVNRKGCFNVRADPQRLRTLPLPSESELIAAGKNRPAAFFDRWEPAVSQAREGDVVLADPPYLGAWSGYTAGAFGFEQHYALSMALHRTTSRGAALIAFNSPAAASLYGGWAKVETTTRKGTISSDGEGREPVGELLITHGLKSPAKAAA